jgi:hypothetical protein
LNSKCPLAALSWGLSILVNYAKNSLPGCSSLGPFLRVVFAEGKKSKGGGTITVDK